jgi:hypothetical protein
MILSNLGQVLEQELPEIITRIASEHNIQPYLQDPDFLERRISAWHQFGLITHTKQVRYAFLHELEPLLKKWGVDQQVGSILGEEVDGLTKRALLEASIPLHDLGKIVVNGLKKSDRNHETASKNLVEQSFLRQRLESLGLSTRHIEKIARYVNTHDIVGKLIRKPLKSQGRFNLAFMQDPELEQMCQSIAAGYPDIYPDTGVFFLCDSLGKTDIRINADNALDIARQSSEVEEILKRRQLPPQLKQGVLQLPVTTKLAEVYMKNAVKTY